MHTRIHDLARDWSVYVLVCVVYVYYLYVYSIVAGEHETASQLITVAIRIVYLRLLYFI